MCPASEAASPEMPSHHASIAAKRVDVVIEQFKAWSVEVTPKPPTRDCHADAIGQPLSQRYSGRLNPGGPTVFQVARALAAKLPKALEVVQRHRQFP